MKESESILVHFSKKKVLKRERKRNQPEMLTSFMTNDKENFEDNQKKSSYYD